jgi:SAM-dependent methyltransferase
MFKPPKAWFKDWFNSHYYHILYTHRDDKEAETFIKNLKKMFPFEHKNALDIACGRGRHAIFLNKQHMDVVGIDLSEENIEFANQFENEHLRFFVHDMRHLFYSNYFDYAFNLFTSFGYFSQESDNIKSLKCFYQSLKKGGLLILDFMNAHKIVHNLVLQEKKKIIFNITRRIEQNTIIKEIEVIDGKEIYYFEENVQALKPEDFVRYFAQVGFKIESIFGNYALEPYHETNSERLIYIARK